MRIIISLAVILIASGTGALLHAQSSVTADGAAITKLVDDCQFTEGPAVAPNGDVYFTDQPNDRILKIDTQGQVTDFLKPAGRSNGLFFAPDGKLIACADEKNEMWEISLDGSHKVLIANYQNTRLNGPNDVWVHPQGWLYFTDPFYKRPWWSHTQMPQEACFLYKAQRDGSQVTRIDSKFKQPNGIIGDPVRNLLYVADIGDKKTYRFRIGNDGTLSERELFCELGSDGMTTDTDGNVYLTGKEGVTVLDSSGKQLEIIRVPEPWTANVCFGGKTRQTLFITSSKSVYAIPMRVQGY